MRNKKLKLLNKIKSILGIDALEVTVDRLQHGTGIGMVKFVRYGEYVGESGSIAERLTRLEEILRKEGKL